MSFPTRERGLKSARGKEDQIRTSSFPTRERGLKWQCSGECHRDPGSFPTRERGLKSAQYGTNVYNAASFPTRERGLKLKPLYRFRCTDTSFPTRERGLKLPSIASLLSGSGQGNNSAQQDCKQASQCFIWSTIQNAAVGEYRKPYSQCSNHTCDNPFCIQSYPFQCHDCWK